MLMVNQLCGFGAGGPSGPPPMSVVQQASATSSADTITAPADIIAGDLLVLVDSANNISGGVPTSVVPSGFTSISDINDATLSRQILSLKRADGSEASAVLTGMNGNITDAKVLLVFRPNTPANNVIALDVGAEATAGNPTPQVASASGGVSPLVVIGAYGSDAAAVSPRTMTPAKDGEVSSTTRCYLAWKIYNSSPADVTVDMDDEGSANMLQSCFIQIS